MPIGNPENDHHDDHAAHEIDQTPASPVVEEIPTAKRTSSRPSALKALMGAAAMAAVGITVTVERNGPKTPRTPPVVSGKGGSDGGSLDDAGNPSDGGIAGPPDDSGAPDVSGIPEADSGTDAQSPDAGQPTIGQEDLCGRQSFAQDVTADDMAKPGQQVCEFKTDPDGTMHIIGHTLIDSDGLPRDCFVQPTFSPQAAMKIRGDISGSMNKPGQISLNSGKLCVMMLDQTQQTPNESLGNEQTKALVIGEASLHIATNQRVIVKILNPEKDPNTDQMMHYALVTPVEGHALIVQDGRTQQFKLQVGDEPLKIPLDIEHPNHTGCIVSTNPGDVQNPGPGVYVLAAGAIFMVIRRRKSAQAQRSQQKI